MTRHSNIQIRDSRAVLNTAGLPADYLLPFAACYAYCPKGESEIAQRSRQLCARVKSGSTQYLKSYAATVHQEVHHGSALQEFFPNPTVFVPVPEFRASGNNTVWVAKRLASALKETGLAADLWTGLKRVSSVERSSSSWMWERPTVLQHYQSFRVTAPSRQAPSTLLLIDDVITKGRTLAAAAIRLQEAFPKADIRAFALIRTMGFVLDIPRLVEPCHGVIHWNGEDAYRAP
jgi:hypothetical protein